MPVIRTAQDEELPIVRRMLNAYLVEYDPTEDPTRSWDDEYMAACRRGMAGGTLAILLLWPGTPGEGEPIGCAIARIEPAWYRASSILGVVEEFYIVPEHRRSGNGRTLARGVFSQLRRMGATALTAHVLRENAPALAFWQRIGLSIEVYQLFARPT